VKRKQRQQKSFTIPFHSSANKKPERKITTFKIVQNTNNPRLHLANNPLPADGPLNLAAGGELGKIRSLISNSNYL